MVSERIRSEEISIWNIVEGSIRVERQSSVGRVADLGDRKSTIGIVAVGIVEQNTARDHIECSVFVGHVTIVIRNRHIVDYTHSDVHCRLSHSAVSIGDFVDKRVNSVEIQIRRVGERSVTVEG